MNDLAELYPQALLSRGRALVYAGRLATPTHSAQAINSLCGDEVAIDLLVVDGVISEVAHRVVGCLICKVSADLLAEYAVGLSVESVIAATPTLGEVPMLAGVRAFPARVKCAELPWLALGAAEQK